MESADRQRPDSGVIVAGTLDRSRAMKTKYIAAIDFGTAFTGVAFADNKEVIDQQDIEVKNDWEGTEAIPRKVPTSVLIDEDGVVQAYGYDAEQRAANSDQHFSLFRHFKMELHTHNMTFNSDMELTAVNGQSKLLASKVVSKALENLGMMVRDFIGLRRGKEPCNDEITWVITVPAIWNISLRQFMRDAVKKAGLCRADCSNLVIGMEPECAALYLEHRHKEMRDGCYAIADCGGGTVDVSYHQCRPDGQNSYTIDELKEVSGDAVGGTLADQRFEELMDKFFGAGTIDTIKNNDVSDYLKLMKEFELLKPNVGDMTTKNISYHRFLPDVSAFCNVPGVSVRKNNIKIEAEKFDCLFQEPVDWIHEHLTKNLSSMPRVDRVYFVGGFSHCKLLTKRMKATLTQPVITDQDGMLAVVKGAILYGKNPSIVKSRRMQMTYGVQTLTKYNPIEHKGQPTEIEGTFYIKNYFSTLICRGDVLKDDDLPGVKNFSPVRSDQTSVPFAIYSSPEAVVKFTTDPGCVKIGTMTLEMPNTEGGKNRVAKVYTSFTGKELSARVVSEKDKTEISCVVKL